MAADNNIPLLKDFTSQDIMYPDEKYAIEHFLGKTFDEAKQLFIENDLYYADDLTWMGQKAFQYYLPAFTDYLISDRDASSDTLNHFISIIKFKIEHEIESILLCRTELLNTLECCLNNYSKYKVEVEIYGDLEIELKKLFDIISGI